MGCSRPCRYFSKSEENRNSANIRAIVALCQGDRLCPGIAPSSNLATPAIHAGSAVIAGIPDRSSS